MTPLERASRAASFAVWTKAISKNFGRKAKLVARVGHLSTQEQLQLALKRPKPVSESKSEVGVVGKLMLRDWVTDQESSRTLLPVLVTD